MRRWIMVPKTPSSFTAAIAETESRDLRMPDGSTRSFRMKRLHWTALDDAVARGHSTSFLAAFALAEWRHDPAHTIDAWLGHIVLWLAGLAWQNETELASFVAFCASQLRSEAGLVAIEGRCAMLQRGTKHVLE